jgi:hypothetical protein
MSQEESTELAELLHGEFKKRYKKLAPLMALVTMLSTSVAAIASRYISFHDEQLGKAAHEVDQDKLIDKNSTRLDQINPQLDTQWKMAQENREGLIRLSKSVDNVNGKLDKITDFLITRKQP